MVDWAVFWTFLDFTKMWTRWTFESIFLKIVHQKGLFDAIKENPNFPHCQRILDIYWQWLLINNKAALTSLLYCLIVWCLVKLETNQSWGMPECLNILSRHNRKYVFYIWMPFINAQASFISTNLQMMKIFFFYRHRDIAILRMADC